MTLTALSLVPSQTARPAPGWAPRSAADLLADQLRALDAWNAARRDTEAALAAVSTNREAMLDARRRAVAVRREAEALLARSAALLEGSGVPLPNPARPRALVVHRQEWSRTTVAGALEAGGAEVLGCLDDGAEAVGWAVAEQPDLLLLEEMLPTLPGSEVVRRVREFSPSTVVAVQVGYEDAVRPMLAAGAHLAVPRRVPPADLVRAVLDRVG